MNEKETENEGRGEAPSLALELAGGHRLHLARDEGGGDHLRLEVPGGGVAISIEVGGNGISLSLDGADLTLRTTGRLALEAEHLVLGGRTGVELVSSRGDVRMKANDDVRLNGERVMVNC